VHTTDHKRILSCDAVINIMPPLTQSNESIQAKGSEVLVKLATYCCDLIKLNKIIVK